MPDQDKTIMSVDVGDLEVKNVYADRFTYSSYFVPVRLSFGDAQDTPVLSFNQKYLLLRYYGKTDSNTLNRWLSDVKLGELLQINKVELPQVEERAATTTPDLRHGTRGEVAISPYPPDRLFGKALDATEGQARDQLLALVQSDVGYLFLDRTRIRPKGFAIGEHLYALSLAPSEEVAIEQRTFSKRQITMEEATEQEKTFDLEMSSTLTTELQESLERQHNLTDRWGLSLSHTGQYKSPEFFWGQINASHTIGFTKDVTEASTETRKRSIRDNQTTSTKVAAKYRALHKVSFKVTEERGLEATSKRVIRNTNKFTPVDFHYFKILQVLELAQERYGARLCWAPFVKDPAAEFFARIQKGKAAIIAKAEAGLPPPPNTPNKPTAGPAETRVLWSPQVEATKWGFLGDMSCDYELAIPMESGWVWDRDMDFVRQSLKVSPVLITRVHAESVIGDAWIADGALKVIVHVGVHNVYESGGDIGKSSRLYLQIGARFKFVATTVVDDAIYKDAYAAYLTKQKEWSDNADKARAQAKADAETWEVEVLKTANPVAELVNRLIVTHFPLSIRDEGVEIEFWQRVFQWDAASYVLYPGWWSDTPMRDSTLDANHFFNASWARVFLPIREDMENVALRWIFTKTSRQPAPPALEDRIEDIIEDLSAFRTKHLTPTETRTSGSGCPDIKERFICLGRWTDVMPTDGTHIEVTQSGSLSIDKFAEQDLKDTGDLRAVLLDSEKEDIALKKKALSQMTGAATVEVIIQPKSSEPKGST